LQLFKENGEKMEEIKKHVVLYTDGACSGNPGLGGYGGILIYGEHKREYSEAVEDTTNNRMEVTAVIEGLKRLKYPCKVDVYSDSAYTVNAFENGWIYAWKKSGWKKADHKPVLNADLWEELYALTRVHEVTFFKVAGHADNELNNRCDKLATGAIAEYRKLHPIEIDGEEA
jgi:ribonuclease HI